MQIKHNFRTGMNGYRLSPLKSLTKGAIPYLQGGIGTVVCSSGDGKNQPHRKYECSMRQQHDRSMGWSVTNSAPPQHVTSLPHQTRNHAFMVLIFVVSTAVFTLLPHQQPEPVALQCVQSRTNVNGFA